MFGVLVSKPGTQTAPIQAAAERERKSHGRHLNWAVRTLESVFWLQPECNGPKRIV